MQELKEKHFFPCEEPVVLTSENELAQLKKLLYTHWEIIDNMILRKVFPFEYFKRGMAFVQQVALLAETENHHPEICTHINSVEVELTTNTFGRLTENDYILAAKIENL